MSELGDVLELLHGARGRYSTARLEARERKRYRLQNEAYERARRRYSGDVGSISYGPPIDLPEINVDDWPYNDASCHGMPSFHQGPLHEWLDTNPGKWDKAYDIRGTDPKQTVIRDFLRQD